MNMNDHLCAPESCTGCLACLNVCPQKAITIIEGFLGEILPRIDRNLCIDCGACDKVCPSLNSQEKYYPQACYAAWTKDNFDYSTSTSGGLATAMSKQIINGGGVVYGCAAIGINVKHLRCTTIEEIEKLKGSKYVQSNVGTIYQDIKLDLKNGKKVLFIGTPCQVGGVKSFLKKDYLNFITVDLICHGVPSIRSLKDSLSHNIKDLDFETISYLSFRNHEKGDFCLECKGKTKNRIPFEFEKGVDYSTSYYPTFFFGNSYRNSCYQCQYAQPQRVSDITIGDFWGLSDKLVIDQAQQGISAVLINTDKGAGFYQALVDNIHSYPESIDEAVINNAQLKSPTIKTKRTKIFRYLCTKMSFENAFRWTYLDRITKSKLKKIIKKIIYYR